MTDPIFLLRYKPYENHQQHHVSPFTSSEACEKSSPWLWKDICVSTGVRKPGNICASPTAMI